MTLLGESKAFDFMGRRVEVAARQLGPRFHWVYAIDGVEHYELSVVGWTDVETALSQGESDATREILRREWRKRSRLS